MNSTPRGGIKSTRSLEYLLPPSAEIDVIPALDVNCHLSKADLSLNLGSPTSKCSLGLKSQYGKSRSSEDISTATKEPVASSPRKASIEGKSRICTRAQALSGPILRHRKSQNVLVRLLHEADYLVEELLKYLPAQDLIRLSHVNRQLRQIVLGHNVSNARRLAYINRLKREREHHGKVCMFSFCYLLQLKWVRRLYKSDSHRQLHLVSEYMYSFRFRSYFS